MKSLLLKTTCGVFAFIFLCTISTSAVAQRNGSWATRNSENMKEALQPLVENKADSMCRVNDGSDRIALGTIVSEDGLIVTKLSEVDDADDLKCVFRSGEQVDAKIVSRQKEMDLALIKVEANELTPINLTPEEVDVEAGNIVVSPDSGGSSISMGLVSVDPRKFAMRQPRTESSRGFLGIDSRPVDEGLQIRSVVQRSGALKAGLKRGDIVMEFEEQKVTSVQQLISLLDNFRPDEEVTVVVKREEETMEFKVTLGEVPAQNLQQDQWGGGPFSDKRFGFPVVIAHDSLIRPNDCGGPLVNSDGKVIGINISRSLRVATYAIPIANVAAFVNANR